MHRRTLFEAPPPRADIVEIRTRPAAHRLEHHPRRIRIIAKIVERVFGEIGDRCALGWHGLIDVSLAALDEEDAHRRFADPPRALWIELPTVLIDMLTLLGAIRHQFDADLLEDGLERVEVHSVDD